MIYRLTYTNILTEQEHIKVFLSEKKALTWLGARYGICKAWLSDGSKTREVI